MKKAYVSYVVFTFFINILVALVAMKFAVEGTQLYDICAGYYGCFLSMQNSLASVVRGALISLFVASFNGILIWKLHAGRRMLLFAYLNTIGICLVFGFLFYRYLAIIASA